MHKFRVRLLLPYEGLVGVVQAVAKDYPALELVASAATLGDAVAQAIEAEREQFDAIVSRGDTMLMIRDAVSIPVFGIEVSGLDLLRAIQLAESYSRKWVFLGFPLIMRQAQELCAMLHNDASVRIIHSIAECESEIEKLRQDGYSMIVGDSTTVSWASKFGLYGIMIASSKESVCKTLSAISFFERHSATYRDTISLYKEVMSKSPRNTLVFNEDEALVLHSGLNAGELSPQLKPYVRRAFSTPFIQNILLRDNEVWKVETRQLNSPDMAGGPYVAFFCNRLNDAGILLDFVKNDSVHVYEPNCELPVPFSSFPHSSPAMRDALNAAQAQLTTGAPLLFAGETGVETDAFVHAAYQSSPYANHSMLQLNCELLTDADWKQLLSNAAQPLFRLLKDASFVLYLNRVDKLSPYAQNLFLNVFSKSQQFHSLWLLASCAGLQDALTPDSRFEKLYYQISPLVINIPPLRQRAEDIADICSLAIGENNVRFGKSIAGIESDALAYLRQYEWPGNLPQFNNAMALIIKNAYGDYISLADVKKVLDFYSSAQAPEKLYRFDLNDTLENIEQAVIRYVYEQEGRNSSKAAERLNIGRSTLWRRLNKNGAESSRDKI